jgi:hypothetical protein
MPELDKRETVRNAETKKGVGEASPLRVFLLGAILIVAVVGIVLVAIRTFMFPIWEQNSEGARQVATAQVQLSVAMTQEATTLMPTASAAVTAGAQDVAYETPLPTSEPRPVTQVTVEANGSSPLSATAVATLEPGTLATPTVDQAAEIAAAYEKYFDVTSQALLNLDGSQLDQVAAGQSLAGLQQTIDQDRSKRRALQTNVEHDVYVIGYEGDDAQVADRYRDSSIYVDPTTHTPLPGEVLPASPDVAPAVSVIYHMQRIGGTWKVVSGQRLVPSQ